MKLSRLVLLMSAATAVCSAHAYVVGYDDTSDPVYSSGWAALQNGGYGFGPWYFSAVSTNGLGNSNSNGSLGGPGINVGGNAWGSQQGIGWTGAMVSRNIGSFTLGNVFEMDVDFGDLSVGSQVVNLFDGALTDYLSVQSTGGTGLMTIQSQYGGTVTTSVPYNDGGFHLSFAMTSSSNVDVSITSLATSTTSTYSILYTGVPGSHELTIGGNHPVPGQEIYTNKFKMSSPVPEPSSLLALPLGFVWLVRRKPRQ